MANLLFQTEIGDGSWDDFAGYTFTTKVKFSSDITVQSLAWYKWASGSACVAYPRIYRVSDGVLVGTSATSTTVLGDAANVWSNDAALDTPVLLTANVEYYIGFWFNTLTPVGCLATLAGHTHVAGGVTMTVVTQAVYTSAQDTTPAFVDSGGFEPTFRINATTVASGTVFTKSLSDALTTADTITKKAHSKSLSDALATTDTITKKAHSKSLSDALTTTDSITKKAHSKNISDALTATDSIIKKVHSKSFSDALTTTDSMTKVYTPAAPTAYTLSLSDAVTTSDTVSKRFMVTVVNTITSSDATTKLKMLHLYDLVAITDSNNLTIRKLMLDTLTVTESQSHHTPNESMTLTDSITVSDSIIHKTFLAMAESVMLTDSLSQRAAIHITLNDVVLTTETISKYLPNAPGIIGTIQLSGNVVLNVYLLGSTNDVYLVGSRDTNVSLKGGLEVTTKDQNFEMYAGDSKNLIVTVTDTNGSPVNLTGATIRWKLTYSSGTIDKTTSNGGLIITSPTGGVFSVKLGPTDTATLQGNFNHDAEMTDTAGNVSTLLVGVGHIYI